MAEVDAVIDTDGHRGARAIRGIGALGEGLHR
jgi:hypothetical protein